MTSQPANLSNCDREPIHIPGKIQSHGFLVLVDEEFTITAHSSNAGLFVSGISEDFNGLPLAYVEGFLENGNEEEILRNMIRSYQSSKDFDQVNPLLVTIGNCPFNVTLSLSGNQYILDFEPTFTGSGTDMQRLLSSSIGRLLDERFLPELLENCAAQTKAIIHYDRVMIYQFAEDGHGEVIAEAKNDNLESWLGLHYPASDIPKQARALYKTNLIRLIADVDSEPVSLVYNQQQTGPVDLTYSRLRAVSPIHIQYLKNMGVCSSYSISILYKDQLWGLIACHNYHAKPIDYKLQQATRLIGQLLSSALDFRREQKDKQAFRRTAGILEKFSMDISGGLGVADALVGQTETLMDVFDTSGAVLRCNHHTYRLGTVPQPEELDQLVNWLFNHTAAELFYTSKLPELYPPAASFRALGSGLMLMILSRATREYVLWFKPEVLQKVRWAGDPNLKRAAPGSTLSDISPRNSFEAWVQDVVGTSDKWSTEEVDTVVKLKQLILNATIIDGNSLRKSMESLRKSYEELDSFSLTIAHDLKNPITAIKGYAQLLKIQTDLPDQTRTILNRIEERSTRMKTMVDSVLQYSKVGRQAPERTTVDVGLLLTEILPDLQAGMPANNISVEIGDTPSVVGDPTMISQVFSNIVSNALKYSAHNAQALVEIRGVEDRDGVTYTIKDNGFGIAAGDIDDIFQLFNRMDNVKETEGTGVGLAIVKRIMDHHHGRIRVESELQKGTTFFLQFPGR